MTGLDLEPFLLLLRADFGTWALLGVGSLILCLLVWMSWGSRRALRKCLVLSVVAHAGLALYGSTVPSVFRALGVSRRDPLEGRHIRTIRVLPAPAPREPGRDFGEAASSPRPPFAPDAKRRISSPDLVMEPRPLADSRLTSSRATPRPPAEPVAELAGSGEPVALATATPRDATPLPVSAAEPRESGKVYLAPAVPPVPRLPAPTAAELGELVPRIEKLKENRSANSAIPSSALAGLATTDLRHEAIREPRPRGGGISAAMSPKDPSAPGAMPLPAITPTAINPLAAAPLADLAKDIGSRGLSEVPPIYRSRLDANRSARAQSGGASRSSEQAVERALDWLARHQDADGRWDGATMRYEDGAPVPGDDDFTVFCPPGETCFGECAYWEADTGLTGLALLAYLGAGYTHREGKYQTTVSKGLDFLIAQQKSDGDLRGASKAVGMYCHSMAALALCEAYALSLDDRLRVPAERAVSFLIRARARDGEAWRYAPGATVGDTSILGWVVMVFKSAREIGLRVPGEADVARGALRWLDRVGSGPERGLARYQPWDPVTPTMTAEAWVCRQFLGVGGPGAASTEAADYLLRHESDRGDSNFYYWYYGTLAMYQHGGPAWSRWNDRVRDRLVRLQRSSGHPAGSWDPDDSLYGARGGRIYCTALGALTLEVYYRYLRLYDAPSLPGSGEPRAASVPPPPLEGPGPR